jgi:protein-S-isoprenylcysteine O-methyltransferase Ste14
VERIAIQVILFVVASIPILIISRRALAHPNSHGFYRTFAWEAILALFLLNAPFWFVDPFSPTQLLAWALLVISLILIIAGVATLRRAGKPDDQRQDDSLIGVEKTTRLVSVGLYRYIRHPFYSSLLFLAWGTFFKHLSWVGLALAAVATVFLFVTGKVEEREDIAYFGEQYREYMKKTKMFVPFLF